MQGIKTQKHGSFRIRASCKARSIIVDRDDSLSHEKQHRAVAMRLAELMGWKGRWVGCTIPGVDGFVWANTGEHPHSPQSFYVLSPQGEDPTKPEEGDIITPDHHHWWQQGKLYYVGNEEGLVVNMDEDKFWPNVWLEDDHGGYTLIRINFTEEEKS